MCRVLLLFVGMFLQLPGFLAGELINRPVVNVYLQPQEDTEVDSQAIYGSVVEVIAQGGGWSKIRMADGVEGWVLSSQLTTNPSYESSDHLRPVKSLFAHIYRVTDTTPYPPLLAIPYGSKVKLDETVDTGERWVSMELLSGEKAWIQRGDVDFSPRVKTLEEVLAFSKKFLGLPYTWGGTSSYGFDCSGFVQMLFREMGVQLPRNSREQARCSLFTSVAEEDLQPGDLVFFGKTRITHVGLYLGNDEFIHCGVTELPMVMISNIKSGKYNFQLARRIDPLMIERYRMNFRY
jgi:gamma-D-glutamyl-L-lysine dipeptidyl-peptidase